MVAYIIHNQINQVFKGSFLEKSDFQIQFSVPKIDDIFLIFFSFKNINLGDQFLYKTFFFYFKFWTILFLK